MKKLIIILLIAFASVASADDFDLEKFVRDLKAYEAAVEQYEENLRLLKEGLLIYQQREEIFNDEEEISAIEIDSGEYKYRNFI